MKAETIHQYLMRRLAALYGMHSTIAQETGVSQATLSRIYRGCDPRLGTAQPILDWIARYDRRAERSAARRTRAAGTVGRNRK